MKGFWEKVWEKIWEQPPQLVPVPVRVPVRQYELPHLEELTFLGHH